MGRYVAAGVTDPKHYPKEPALAEAKENKKFIATTDEQRLATVRIKYSKKD